MSLSPITKPTGWASDVSDGAKEFTGMLLHDRMPHPCLILSNAQGIYDKIAIYTAKDAQNEDAYCHTFVCSSDADFHRSMMAEANAVVCMPALAQRYFSIAKNILLYRSMNSIIR